MRGWGERELVYAVRAKEFLTVPKEQATRLSRRMSTLSGTHGLPPASPVSLLYSSLSVAFSASLCRQLPFYMRLLSETVRKRPAISETEFRISRLESGV